MNVCAQERASSECLEIDYSTLTTAERRIMLYGSSATRDHYRAVARARTTERRNDAT